MSSQQPETPKTPHAEPILCKMGCGFFGNNATGDCCSKCWAQIRPKEEPKQEEPSQPPKSNEASQLLAPSKGEVNLAVAKAGLASTAEENPTTSQEVVTKPATETTGNDEVGEEVAVASPAKKKKKKKTSYKSMMANMLEGTGTKDVEKEKEKLRDVMGGGHFKKVDRI